MAREQFQWLPHLNIAVYQGNETAKRIIAEARTGQADTYFDGPTHKEEITAAVENEASLFPESEIYLIGSRAVPERRSLKPLLYSDTDLLVVCPDDDANKPEFSTEEITGTGDGIHIIRLTRSAFNTLSVTQTSSPTTQEEAILRSIVTGPRIRLFPQTRDATILTRIPSPKHNPR